MAEVLRRIQLAARFKKDYRIAARHPEFSDEDLEQLLDDLIHRERLPTHYREHPLTKRGRNWAGYWECHLGPDLVVIYRRFERVIRMHRIGGHAELFAASGARTSSRRRRRQ